MSLSLPLQKRPQRAYPVIILVIALPLSFRTFQYFPGFTLIQEAWFILVALALAFSYLTWRKRQGGTPKGFEAYVLLLMLVIPFWSALAAWREFDQPMIYGLLVHRYLALIAGVPLLIGIAISRHHITFKDLEAALLILVWSTFALFLVMYLGLNPSSYFDSFGVGFVTGSMDEAQFKFELVFVVFGFYYYLFRGMRRESPRDYIRAGGLFLFMLLAIRGRSLMLSLLGAYVVLAWLWAPNLASRFRFLPKVALAIAVVWAGLFFLNHDLYLALMDKFSDAFTVVFSGDSVDDVSANARIEQTVLAMPYITKNWLTGNGVISNQWSGGTESVMSGYFHPTDIGIIGVVFQYGVLGLFLCLIQFGYAFAFARKRISAPSEVFDLLRAAKAQILFYGFTSLSTGYFIYRPEIILFFIGLLWMASNVYDSKAPRPIFGTGT